MTFLRGAAYGLRGYPPPAALLVVTNDLWNTRMNSVGGVLVSPGNNSDTFPVRLSTRGGWANPTRLLALPMERLEAVPRYRASATEMHTIEATLRTVTAMHRLLQKPPKPPDLPAGSVNYPLWGEIYYGPAIQGQPKRFVVVSVNIHNAKVGRVLAVRLTSKPKRSRAGIAFPLVSNGLGHACCGDISYLDSTMLRWTSGQGRPKPSSLALPDMVEVIRGIKETLAL